jgi:hypothetical protein
VRRTRTHEFRYVDATVGVEILMERCFLHFVRTGRVVINDGTIVEGSVILLRGVHGRRHGIRDENKQDESKHH